MVNTIQEFFEHSPQTEFLLKYTEGLKKIDVMKEEDFMEQLDDKNIENVDVEDEVD